MSIKGETEKINDSIALTGLYIDEKYCKHEPLSAKEGNKHKTYMSYMYSYTFAKNFTFTSCHIYETIQNKLMTFVRKIPLKVLVVSHKNGVIEVKFLILVGQIKVCD